MESLTQKVDWGLPSYAAAKLHQSEDVNNESEKTEQRNLLQEEEASPTNLCFESDLQKRKRRGKADKKISPVDQNATICEIVSHPSLSFDAEEVRRQSVRRKQKKLAAAATSTQEVSTQVTQTPISVPKLVIRDGKICYEAAETVGGSQKDAKVIDHSDYRVTSNSFKTRTHTEKWSGEETKKFYKGLEIFGSDFSMIANLFPSRTRAQIKNKFNKEERTNAKGVEEALVKHRCRRHVPIRVLQSVNEGETPQNRSSNVRKDSVDSLDLVKYSLQFLSPNLDQ
eukprot:TRINITY_DN2401_c0_g1_i2.p1 TRINITY_DN2401_c0_g1~~TRINITY_DN2401_c0_g1_i2.p1  ORF type:complete len:283 (+),score=64.75 TRINITY_DN2401_c0_g1_i2:173-1021(+)